MGHLALLQRPLLLSGSSSSAGPSLITVSHVGRSAHAEERALASGGLACLGDGGAGGGLCVMEPLNLGSESAPCLQKVSKDKTGSSPEPQITLNEHTDLSRGLSEVGSSGGPGGSPLVMRGDAGWDSVPPSLHQGVALSEEALRFQPLVLLGSAFGCSAVSSVELPGSFHCNSFGPL